MTSAIRSAAGIRLKPYPYEGFTGIDRSRDIRAMDTGQNQALYDVVNGVCDFRGSIVMNPGASQRSESGQYPVDHVSFFGRNLCVWAENEAGYISLTSDRGHRLPNAYPQGAVISSTVFNKKNIFFSRNNGMKTYDGQSFMDLVPASNPKPAFGVPIQGRLAIAGMQSRRTVVDLSRVDTETIFSEDEELNAPAVTKAAFFDVGNIIGTQDEITGLGVFENNKLVVFANDQALVYTINPDYTKWALDERSNIRIGCISHNTIVSVGSDLLFCSRSGIHSIRRSEANGITIYSLPLSSRIDELYRQLVRRVPDKASINAFFDADLGHYHVFFPISRQLCERITFAINPIPGQESHWSRANFLNARCGASLGGQVVLGTSGGVWDQTYLQDVDASQYPELTVVTPILWHGAINETKDSYSFILQASGKGEVLIEAANEDGNSIGSMTFEIEDDSVDDEFLDVPLVKQYERKFEHRYRGVQFRLTITGRGLVKVVGFAVVIRAG